MNPKRTPIPGMPRIKELSRFSTMGIWLSTCITAREHIWLWTKTRPSHARFSRPESDPSWPYLRWVGSTTATSGKPPDLANLRVRFHFEISVW